LANRANCIPAKKSRVKFQCSRGSGTRQTCRLASSGPVSKKKTLQGLRFFRTDNPLYSAGDVGHGVRNCRCLAPGIPNQFGSAGAMWRYVAAKRNCRNVRIHPGLRATFRQSDISISGRGLVEPGSTQRLCWIRIRTFQSLLPCPVNPLVSGRNAGYDLGSELSLASQE